MTPGKINVSESASTMDIPIAEQCDRIELSADLADLKKPVVAFGGDLSHACDRNEAKLKHPDKMEEELLGSLTSMSSPAVRTSARVIQKMKMDSIRPVTPPPSDKRDSAKDDHHRNASKTPNQSRPSKTIWINAERTLFFDALNEFGKDFEAIANFINGKQKRKTAADPAYKAKEHVRLLYYQTFTKISKYLRFSDDVAKKVQELYALINYGEMRKKIPVDNQKFFMKLRELVYRGSVTWRVKGKNCRIKTPSCPALRKINQVEKWQEDIKLPAKVEVELKPSDNESWYAVQSLAQNPRVKTSLPLQKRLISLLKTLQYKWRSREAKMWDHQLSTTKPNPSTSTSSQPHQPAHTLENGSNEPTAAHPPTTTMPFTEPILCITPPLDATIHRPYVTLTDLLNSNSICLNSYEERIEASVRGETLCAEHITNVRDTVKSNAKRQRHDSGSEKKSPDTKRTKAAESERFDGDLLRKTQVSTSQDGMSTTSNDDLMAGIVADDRDFASPTYESAVFDMDVVSHQMPDILSADECERLDDLTPPSEAKKEGADQQKKSGKKAEPKGHVSLGGRKRAEMRPNNRDTYRPLIDEDVLQKIRRGWHLHNIGDLTIGDLYIMFGSEGRLRLEYNWQTPFKQAEVKAEPNKAGHKMDQPDGHAADEHDAKADGLMNGAAIAAAGEADCADTKPAAVADIRPKTTLSNKLKQLLLLAGMMEKTKRKQSCACGHYCDRGVNKIKKEESLVRSYVSNKIYQSTMTDNTLFRTPHLPNRTARAAQQYEPYRINLNVPRSKQNRWQKSRINRTPKQVVVQRLLPLQPGISQPYMLPTPDANYATPNMANVPLNGPMGELLALAGPSTTPPPPIEHSSTLTAENLNRLNTLSAHQLVQPPHRPTDISKLLDEDSDTECDREIESCGMGNGLDGMPQLDSDEEENRRLQKQFNEDPGIQCLMDISLPSPLPMTAHHYFEDNSQPSIGPMGILSESPVPSASKWFEENLNDFSLSSFLGHLESNCDGRRSRSRSPNRLLDGSNMSTINDTSIDYMSRFEELAAESMKNDSITP